eukprot:CCRYP_020835-RA/>CCRYP_020835-RA protein AED:0.47 eAED:0.47 QI:0/-1/0/1/-1/1/1/0/102
MTRKKSPPLSPTAATTFQPISGQPSDDDLTELRGVLYPLLLDIPCDEGGTHNLIGLIEPTTSYTATWGAQFPPRAPTCLSHHRRCSNCSCPRAERRTCHPGP